MAIEHHSGVGQRAKGWLTGLILLFYDMQKNDSCDSKLSQVGRKDLMLPYVSRYQ